MRRGALLVSVFGISDFRRRSETPAKHHPRFFVPVVWPEKLVTLGGSFPLFVKAYRALLSSTIMASPYTGRVIIRTDSRFLDSYNNIVTEWVKLCGAAYDSDEDKDNWHKKNLIRIIGIDKRRIYIVIDIGLNNINPADSG